MQNTVTKRRERQRLKELFLGIEPLAANPARDTPEIHHEPENPPAHIADLDKPFLEDVTNPVDIDANLYSTPQVEQQHSDGLNIQEQGQIESSYSNENLKNLHQTNSSLKVVRQTNAKMQAAPQTARQLMGDELSGTYWQAVGIGVVTGIIITGLVLVFTFKIDLFDNLGRITLTAGEILFGIFGALVSKPSKRTWRGIWVTSIGWALVPVLAALIFILLLTLITLTSFFGV